MITRKRADLLYIVSMDGDLARLVLLFARQ
jgi:hypothetical protein